MHTIEPVVEPANEHGMLYWFFRNSRDKLKNYYQAHRAKVITLLVVVAALSFMLRAAIHPYVLLVRQKSFLLVLAICLVVIWFWAKRKRPLIKVVASTLVALVAVAMFMWGGAVHDYVALYYRYKTLDIRELNTLPITNHERLQPVNSIYVLSHEATSEMESPQHPDFVRVGDEFRWTIAYEPAHFLPRFFQGRVKEIANVRADTPSPNFSQRDQVNFPVGESLMLGRNSLTASIKRFGIWRYFHYEPTDVRVIKDDAGEWVQVVSLIRWKGLFFPRPEFGGVQVIRQEHSSLVGSLTLMFFGTGEWIRPEEIYQHRYLVGQNILGYEVSRYFANSFRFQSGFLGPMPGNHQGDVRVPDIDDDLNEQPFTTYFEQVADRPGMLYHYFALEPFDPDKQGLNVSLFVPADGSGPTYVYKHFEKSGTLTGFSAIAAKIMDTRKDYDWTRHRPVEHRPFIRDINGQRQFYVLTTIVTLKDGQTTGDEKPGQKSGFIAGTGANIVITDAARNIPVWVSVNSNNWEEEIKKEVAKWGVNK